MHLYLHVPFCARRCSYCDFAIAVRREVPCNAYAEAVLAEWREHLNSGRWDRTGGLATVYLGGGTPSLLAPPAIGRILDHLARDRGIVPGAEVTLEANPEDVTPERAGAWRAAGVNRISLGAQSFDPRVLTWMHRLHDAEAVRRAVVALRRAGFTNLSLDLIYGIPVALGRDWGRDLEAALALDPQHLSVYGLTVEPRTPLGRWMARGETTPAPDDQAAAEYLEAEARLRDAGLAFYEVSNAARPGYESQHNQVYWRGGEYLGLGPSAHSARLGERWWNVRDWEPYRRAVFGGELPIKGRERLSDGQRRLEAIYLGLRTREGVPASSLPVEERAAWQAAGWADCREGRVTLTAEGWLRLDTLVGRVP